MNAKINFVIRFYNQIFCIICFFSKKVRSELLLKSRQVIVCAQLIRIVGCLYVAHSQKKDRYIVICLKKMAQLSAGC